MLKLISCSATLALAAALGGCTTNVVFGGNGGGGEGGDATTTTTVTTTTAGVGGSPSTTTTGGGVTCSGPNTAGPAAACTPQDVGCKPGQSACAAVEVVNGAPDFTLKMTHVTFDKPAALASGIAKGILENWLGPAPPICHIPTGLLAWILHFDLAAGTLTTGGARAGAGMAPGFQLIDDPGAQSAPIVPAIGSLALGADCAIDVTVGDLNVPVQYDPGSPGNIYLPFRNLRFHGGSISPDHNCIGVYNEALLSPDNGCAPTPGVPAYTDGAELDGFIRLEEADSAIIGVLQQSLCVFLSQDPDVYGQQVDQYKLCARDGNGQIVFKGDWCAATDQPATPDCSDAVRVHATFAASGVKLAN